MRAPQRATTFLFHILVCCNRLEDVRSTVSEDEFKSNYRIYEAAVRYIESMGEAARRLDRVDPTYLQRHGITVARDVIGMRNRLAHQYEAVDLDLVWQVLIRYAPDLRSSILPVLTKLDPHRDLASLEF